MSNKKYKLQDFINIATIKGGYCLSKEYISMHDKLHLKCKRHHEWQVRAGNIANGSWCRECNFIDNRKHTCDFDFFKKDTPESFYIAGFWCADGWVCGGPEGYVSSIELSIKDIQHLKNIKNILNSTVPIKTSWSSGVYTKNIPKQTCEIHISSKEIFNDLAKFGVVPNKTYKVEMSEWLMNHKYINHFLRGYIDGDGCFCKAKNKNQRHHITFSMRGTYTFLNQFHNIMLINNVAYRKRRYSKPLVGKKELMFDKIQYSGNSIIERLSNFLYKNSTICLQRKKDIADMAKTFKSYDMSNDLNKNS